MVDPKFLFADQVVVEDNLVGVIVRTWIRLNGKKKDTVSYEVYVRSYNSIIEYPEDKINRYKVRHKELDGEELEWQNS